MFTKYKGGTIKFQHSIWDDAEEKIPSELTGIVSVFAIKWSNTETLIVTPTVTENTLNVTLTPEQTQHVGRFPFEWRWKLNGEVYDPVQDMVEIGSTLIPVITG